MEILSLQELQQRSEMQGGRKLRDFEYFHVKPIAAGTLASEYEFFRSVSGAQLDISTSATSDMSNLVMGGKFDEPFYLTHIGVLVYSKVTSAKTDKDRTVDYEAVMTQGRFRLELNNSIVFERTPIARVGSVLNFSGFAAASGTGNDALIAHMSSMIRPYSLEPNAFYCEEGLTFKAAISFTTPPTVTTNILLGVYLIGGKFFKA